MLLPKTGWGQVVIASEGFNNNLSLFSVSGGTFYTGISSSSDGPANSPFFVEGTHSYGKTSGTATITSLDINTIGYSNIQMTLKVAAFSIGNAIEGMDAEDYVKMEISTDGGSSYYFYVQISGNTNAYWGYLSGTGNASVSYPSPYPAFSPSGGGNRTDDGYSTITVTNLPSISKLKFRLTLFCNNSKERWVIDDFKLISNIEGFADPKILMFSEYLAASSTSNNKVLELFNGTSGTINLSDYKIVQFQDGASKTSGTRYVLEFSNPTYLLGGETFVIVNINANSTLQSYADLSTSNNVMTFSGNDALAIYKATDLTGTTINTNAIEIDIFGKIGQNPGSAWTNSNFTISTVGMNLKRKSSVISPVINNPNEFNPELEYNGFANNDYSGLGFHGFELLLTTNQSLPSRAYHNLAIDGNAINVSLLGNSLIKNLLSISSGILKLGNNILTINGTYSITSPSISNMIVLDDGTNLGTLKVKVSTNGTYNFYIGDTRGTTEYSPAKVTFSGCTFDNAYLTIRMQNVKHPANTSNANYINRYWIFEQTGINFGTSGYYDIELNYVDGDIVPYENQMYFGKYNGSYWENLGDADDANNKLIKSGLKSFSDFTGGTETGMPVKLSSFISGVNGRNVNLKWVTEKEENNSGFEVQRLEFRSLKTGGRERKEEWKNIGFVQGKGNSNEPVSYNFEDRNLTSGKYKYRLKQVDYNGNYEYYELDNEVEIGVPEKFYLEQNYPNPFNPETNINFALPEKGFVFLKVYDVLGREVSVILNEVMEAGYHTVSYNASGLPSGIYFYRLNSGINNGIKKMIVIR